MMKKIVLGLAAWAFLCSCGGTNIHDAVKNENMSMVKYYIAEGRLNERGAFGHTPLIIASYYGYPSMVRFLCEQGANVNAQDQNGSTALMYAADFRFPSVVEALLECGADPGIKDNSGHTALDRAQAQNFRDIEEMLQQKTASH
jgi:ankyrin repeat protein